MIIPVVIICFIIILILVASISYNINHYNILIKDTWCDSPIILTVLLALSLVSLTTAVFVNYEDHLPMIPLYFIILFFELVIFIAASSKMFLTSVSLSAIVFILTGFEMVFSIKSKNPELCWLISPFLFFSLIQLAVSDNLYKYNFDHTDILEAIANNESFKNNRFNGNNKNLEIV